MLSSLQSTLTSISSYKLSLEQLDSSLGMLKLPSNRHATRGPHGCWPGLQGLVWKPTDPFTGRAHGHLLPQEGAWEVGRVSDQALSRIPTMPGIVSLPPHPRLGQQKDSRLEISDTFTEKGWVVASGSQTERLQRFSGPISLDYSLELEWRRGQRRGTQGSCLTIRNVSSLPQ